MLSRTRIATGVVATLALVAVLTVSRGQSGQDASPPDVAQAVLARLAAIQRAAQALDPDQVFSFVLENDAGALAQDGRLLRTRAEALASTREGFRGLTAIRYDFDAQQVTLLSAGVALATGEGSSTATTADGRTFTTRFAQSVVLVLTNGQWMVFHAHRSFPRAR